jgi:hypothetical protein
LTFFRAISVTAIMAALLVLYRVHPVVGWSTLATLAVGLVALGHRGRAHQQSS